MSHRQASRVPPRKETRSYAGFDARGWYFVQRDPVSRDPWIDPATHDFQIVPAEHGVPGSLELL